MRIYPEIEEFKRLAGKGNLVPIYTEIFADMETPVSAFRKIEGKNAFLLESVVGGERLARYSFLGSNPSVLFSAKGNKVKLVSNGKTTLFTEKRDCLAALKKLMSGYKPVDVEGLPPFTGGAVGYLGYDMVRYFEDIPEKNKDDRNLPDACFMITDTLVVFDHIKHTIKVVANVLVKGDQDYCYKQGVKAIKGLVNKLKRPVKDSILLNNRPEEKECRLVSNTTKKEYEAMVEKVKEYIKAGDIFQAVVSQRLSAKTTIDSFDIYRALRVVNPSPYMFYLKYGGFRIVGASPEIMVKVEKGVVTERPIAGTRKRGEDDKEDEKLIEELLNDPKEKAEHVMLVDLARNDLGRVCNYRSIVVDEMMTVEKYAFVMHIVSNVKGKLRNDRDVYDVIRSCFPAGTVSGAPKIRAMEIIEEVENVQRGPYAGMIGYFGFNGNLDSCITLRTMIVSKGKVYVQAGAGIVSDSNPASEYQETLNKAKALMSAVELAKHGL